MMRFNETYAEQSNVPNNPGSEVLRNAFFVIKQLRIMMISIF
jgi:hypothetical protein